MTGIRSSSWRTLAIGGSGFARRDSINSTRLLVLVKSSFSSFTMERMKVRGLLDEEARECFESSPLRREADADRCDLFRHEGMFPYGKNTPEFPISNHWMFSRLWGIKNVALKG